MNWGIILEQTNVDLANHLLEEKIISILESEAPMKTLQNRSNYNSYILTPPKH